ncbi:MAG: PKD domain-containing protein [Candidatus Saccharimonadales bacterium]
MKQMIRQSVQWSMPVVIGMILLTLCLFVASASALTPLPEPNPKENSYGLEATKTQPAPTRGATITTPADGASFSTSPISVNGICPTGLLVQVYNNGVMVGAVMCKGGSFSVKVSLFAGMNELSALVYDDIDQVGPKSNVRKVTYTDTNFTSFGELVTLTSSYGRRSAPINAALSWPLQLSGGTGPYAFSIDWGDGTDTVIQSQSLAGIVTIRHVYKKAGIYQANIKVVDKNGVSAFLSVIAVANGQVDGAALNADTSKPTEQTAKVLWIPAAICLLLLLPTYWLGRRSQLVSLRNKMLKERESYQKE